MSLCQLYAIKPISKLRISKMEYTQELLNYQEFTLVTYQTLDGKKWVTITEMSNATGVEHTKIKSWFRNVYKGKEFLKVKVGKTKVEARAYPLEILVELLNYLQDEGHIRPLRFTLGGLIESLSQVQAIKKNDCNLPLVKTVYLIRAANTNVYKIGYTGRDIKDRLKALQTSSANQLTCLYHRKVPSGRWLERMLHNHYASKRMVGEWFNLTDAEVKECIDLIKSA